MRTPSAKAKSDDTLKSLIAATTKLWQSYHLTYEQARSVATEVRRETIHHTSYASRRIQQIIKETADQAKITTRVYPHLLRHSVATTLRERGMALEQIQTFLGHSKLETTQMYAESSSEMIKGSNQKALAS